MKKKLFKKRKINLKNLKKNIQKKNQNWMKRKNYLILKKQTKEEIITKRKVKIFSPTKIISLKNNENNENNENENEEEEDDNNNNGENNNYNDENNDGVKIVIKNNKDNKYYNKNNNYKQYYDNEEEGEQYEDEEDENN